MRERGSITIIAGTMFSGKTKELHHMVDRFRKFARKTVKVFKPKTDTRSRKGFTETADRYSLLRVAAIEIDPRRPAEIMRYVLSEKVEVVAFDEIQFFPPDSGFVEIVDCLLSLGYEVIAAGLDLDFAGRPFGSTPLLMAMLDGNPKDRLIKLQSYCKRCGAPARLPQRLVKGKPAPFDSPLIKVGGAESYEPRCYACHEVPGKPLPFSP